MLEIISTPTELLDSILIPIKSIIYFQGIISRIADDEYKRTINDYNSKIQREMDLIRRHFEEKYQKEVLKSMFFPHL
jgi:hypothetical protein